MKFKLQLVELTENNLQKNVYDITTLNKSCDRVEDLGITISESKEICKQIQAVVVEQQTEQFIANHNHCPHCNNAYRCKSHRQIQFHTPFGKVLLNNPRYYYCDCQDSNTRSFSPLGKLFSTYYAPELSYIEAKWASLVSYGLTVKVLQDFLPLNDELNAATVRNHTLATAKKSDDELDKEQHFYVSLCMRNWKKLPHPNSSITMGIDGGYVRQWENKKKNFEVIAGKSMTSRGKEKYFGLVQSVDQKPKRRVYEMLKSQGMQENQKVIFLSDGAENIWQLQRFLNPRAKHILDWFHISMRFTNLINYAKGYQKYNPGSGTELLEELHSAKWHLWHGHTTKGYEKLEDLSWMVESESRYPLLKKFNKALDEMCTYIHRNSPMIVNYGKRWRNGERISTGFVESTVNCFVTKRFAKKQQMQWSPFGAHMLMQIRAKVMNDELGLQFKKWYPNIKLDGGNMVKVNNCKNTGKIAA